MVMLAIDAMKRPIDYDDDRIAMHASSPFSMLLVSVMFGVRIDFGDRILALVLRTAQLVIYGSYLSVSLYIISVRPELTDTIPRRANE